MTETLKRPMAIENRITWFNFAGGLAGSILTLGIAYGMDLQWRNNAEEARKSAEGRIMALEIAQRSDNTEEARKSAEGRITALEIAQRADHDVIVNVANDIRWIRRKLEQGTGSTRELFEKAPY